MRLASESRLDGIQNFGRFGSVFQNRFRPVRRFSTQAYNTALQYNKLLKTSQTRHVAVRRLPSSSSDVKYHVSSRCVNRVCLLMPTKPYIYTIYTSPTLSHIPRFNCRLLLSTSSFYDERSTRSTFSVFVADV
jgi:hypothetical protein